VVERTDGTGSEKQMNQRVHIVKGSSERGRAAFTLVELLVVIAIIALLAAMVVPLAKVATTKMRLARVNAELNRYVTAIETYKLEAGEYPPDNGTLKTYQTSNPAWKKAAAYNPLFYELSGAVFTNRAGQNVFLVIDSAEEITPINLKNYFGVDGIRNSARDRHDRPFKGFSFREAEHRATKVEGVELLEVPVPSVQSQMLVGKIRNNPAATNAFNPWYYDSSTTNRHNKKSFDLWAEILIGKEVHVIGNWKS
jgi:prepilin-type N-terminal cleavage/methylation domain-containing protein